MRYIYTLQGETPAKKNSLTKFSNGRIGHTRRFYDWHDISAFEISRQAYPPKPLDCPLAIKVEFYHADRTRRDSDNALTSILDLLKDVNIIKDDCWSIVRELSVVNRYDKGNAHCVITITDSRN